MFFFKFQHLVRCLGGTLTDIFVVTFCVALTERFRKINAAIKKRAFSEPSTSDFWSEIREDYLKAASMCKRVDDAISLVVLINIASNLMIIIMTIQGIWL